MAEHATTEHPRALSRRARVILGFVVDFVAGHGYAPTIREIQQELEISSISVVAYHLDALQDAGYLRRSPKISRSIVLLPLAHRVWR